LVSEGRISTGALAEAGDNVVNAVELSRALLNRGLIAKEALVGEMRRIVAGVMDSVFTWEGGTATFSSTESLPEFFEGDVLETFELILRGIMRMVGFAPINEAMLGLDNKLRVRKQTPLPIERLALTPAHGFILSRIDGTITAAEVLSTLPPEEDEKASRFLFGLLIMGVLEYDPALSEGPFRVANILRDHADRRALEKMQEQTIQQVYSQMQSQDNHGVLGLSRSATRKAIERAYGEAKMLFSKERILPRVREKFRSELAVIESRLVEAYLKLTQPDRGEAGPAAGKGGGGSEGPEKGADDFLMRVELDKTKSKVALEEASKVAESYFAQARKAEREKDYFGAIEYCKLAISFNAEEARYYYMMAECQARNPESRWQRQAEQNYAKATELDPWNVEYLLSLGRFYKGRGMTIRARKQFQAALKISPSHDEAEKELDSIN
jgi:tetratricopeptide (TPR) repeat protein